MRFIRSLARFSPANRISNSGSLIAASDAIPASVCGLTRAGSVSSRATPVSSRSSTMVLLPLVIGRRLQVDLSFRARHPFLRVQHSGLEKRRLGRLSRQAVGRLPRLTDADEIATAFAVHRSPSL